MNAVGRYAPYVLAAILVAAFTLARVSGLTDALSLDAVLAKRQALQDLASSHPVLAPLTFALTYVAVAALALPVAALLSLVGGFLFGIWLGTLLVLTSATAGALIVFLVTRSAIGEPLRRKAGPLYAKIADNMRQNAIGYLLFMRLVPLFPFFLVNLVSALFEMKVRHFVLATFIGMAPATLIYVNFGRQIGSVTSIGSLMSPSVLMALTGLGLLVLTPIVYRQWARGRSNSLDQNAENDA